MMYKKKQLLFFKSENKNVRFDKKRFWKIKNNQFVNLIIRKTYFFFLYYTYYVVQASINYI